MTTVSSVYVTHDQVEAMTMGSPAMNFLDGESVENGVKIADYTLPVPREVLQKATDGIEVGVRPEHFRVVDGTDGIPIEVTVVEELGADAYIYGTTNAVGTPGSLVVRGTTRREIEKGATVYIQAEPAKI